MSRQPFSKPARGQPNSQSCPMMGGQQHPKRCHLLHQATANPTGWSELPHGKILKKLNGEVDFDQIKISIECLKNAE